MWSHSKLKDWEECPHRILLYKSFPRKSNPFAEKGINLHKQIEQYLKGKSELPELENEFFKKELIELYATAEAEKKIAVDNDWKPCNWDNAWGRFVLDAYIYSPELIKIIDFKTGKHKPLEHADQAQKYALATNAHYPNIPICVEFWYLMLGKRTFLNYTQDQLNKLRPILETRIKKMEHDTVYRPRPAKYTCLYCSVNDHCEFKVDGQLL